MDLLACREVLHLDREPKAALQTLSRFQVSNRGGYVPKWFISSLVPTAGAVCAVIVLGALLSAAVEIARPGSILAGVLSFPAWCFCHQLPTRSPWAAGHPVPLCWRCLGLYGLFPGTLALARSAAIRRLLFHPWVPLALAPALIDGLSQTAGLRESNNAIRFATGVLAGVALGALGARRLGRCQSIKRKETRNDSNRASKVDPARASC